MRYIWSYYGADVQPTPLTWIEIDQSALLWNAAQLRSHLDRGVKLCGVVKSNAYGHDQIICSRILEEEAACDWLGVHSLSEAEFLREAGIGLPVYVMGYVSFGELEKAFSLDVRMAIYNLETAEMLEKIGEKIGKKMRVHLKVETGSYRQGVCEDELDAWCDFFKKSRFVELDGASTHFANIEDEQDRSYSIAQMERMKSALRRLNRCGLSVSVVHQANSGAALLYPEYCGNMARSGIALYGLWPSESVRRLDCGRTELQPVMTWKSLVAQVKNVPEGSFIGYGGSYVAKRSTKLAIVPVGYADGYDRKLSNRGHVLIHGARAPVVGRVCMNIIMVDITDIAGVQLEDEVVLLGRQGKNVISADELAEWASTINYEVVSRIREGIQRKMV